MLPDDKKDDEAAQKKVEENKAKAKAFFAVATVDKDVDPVVAARILAKAKGVKDADLAGKADEIAAAVKSEGGEAAKDLTKEQTAKVMEQLKGRTDEEKAKVTDAAQGMVDAAGGGGDDSSCCR